VPTQGLPKSGLRQPYPNQRRLLPSLPRYVYTVQFNSATNAIHSKTGPIAKIRSGRKGGRDGQFARHYPAAAGRNQQQAGGLHLRRTVNLSLFTLPLLHSVTLFCSRRLRRNLFAATTTGDVLFSFSTLCRYYLHGTTWHPVMGPFGPMDCVNCKCKSGRIECQRLECPSRPALNCERPVKVAGRCCPVCPLEGDIQGAHLSRWMGEPPSFRLHSAFMLLIPFVGCESNSRRRLVIFGRKWLSLPVHPALPCCSSDVCVYSRASRSRDAATDIFAHHWDAVQHPSDIWNRQRPDQDAVGRSTHGASFFVVAHQIVHPSRQLHLVFAQGIRRRRLPGAGRWQRLRVHSGNKLNLSLLAKSSAP